MVHEYKVRKLKTLCHLATLQTSELQRPEFAFLGLVQRLEVPELILEELYKTYLAGRVGLQWHFKIWISCLAVDLRSIPLCYPL